MFHHVSVVPPIHLAPALDDSGAPNSLSTHCAAPLNSGIPNQHRTAKHFCPQDAIRKHRVTTETFLGMVTAALIFLTWEFWWGSAKYNEDGVG